MGIVPCFLCNKIEKCKDDADVDEIFFVAAFFSFVRCLVWVKIIAEQKE